MSGLVERILRHGWNSGIWKGAYSDMASIRERNGKYNVIYSYVNDKGERKWQFLSELKAAFSITPIPIVSLTVCRVIKESVKAKVKGDNNYEQ